MKIDLKSKLSRDIIWTMASFGILALSGIVINFIITGYRDTASLGIFNLTYSIYVVCSQIAAMGLHYSVLRQTTLLESDTSARGTMLATAVCASFVLGVTMAALVELLSPALVRIFDTRESIVALRYASLGLILFPVTKVLIAYVNGARHMRAYSVFQATRYLVVMAWVTLIAVSGRQFEEATLCFFVAESVTIVSASVYLVVKRELRHLRVSWQWVTEHLRFGSKSLLAGMFVEMNARVDVILLGLFLSDKQVGIYSFAAMLADGVYHLLAMIRVNFNPILVAAIRDRKWDESQRLLQQTRRILPLGTAAFSGLLILSLYLISEHVLPSKGIDSGLLSLVILLAGITAIAAFVPFDNLLLTSGFPSLQTAQQVIVLIVNAGLNLALVPVLGIEGAAIGTVAGYVVGVFVLIHFARQKVGWNLVTNAVEESVVTRSGGV